MTAKPLTGLLILGLALGGLWAQEKPKEEQAPSGTAASAQGAAEPVQPPKVTDVEKARKNPMKYTAVSVERGHRIFRTQCAMCHGENGNGKGDMVEEMKISPPDFTNAETLSKRTDGELFALMNVGSALMPEQRRMTDSHKWNIVNFIRSLAGKAPEKATGKEPEENVILIPQ